MLRLAFDFIITWRETRTRPNAYETSNLHIKLQAMIYFFLLPTPTAPQGAVFTACLPIRTVI